jgi:hypothetical protein
VREARTPFIDPGERIDQIMPHLDQCTGKAAGVGMDGHGVVFVAVDVIGFVVANGQAGIGLQFLDQPLAKGRGFTIKDTRVPRPVFPEIDRCERVDADDDRTLAL